jgi:branched-chain amino acid transport system substrate-binding protein
MFFRSFGGSSAIMKKTLLVVIILLAAAGAYYLLNKNSAIKFPGRSSETIKIVASHPMRGIAQGQNIVSGIKMALEEVNYKAGNYKIELIVEDDGNETGQWQEGLERQIAEKAAADPDVMVYVGNLNSGAAKISIPINNKANLAQISVANTWPGLTKPGFASGEPGIFYPTGVRNYFRTCATDSDQGPFAAIWAKELGAKNVYIYDDGESFGKGVADLFSQKAKEIGLNVLGQKTIDKTAADLTEELDKIKDLDVDMIYFGGMAANGAIPLAKAIKQLGLKAKLMGPDGIMDQAFIDGAGEAAEGVYATVTGMNPKELKGDGKIFFDKYVAKYGKEPETYADSGYEAAKVILEAIANAGAKDRQKILEKVAGLKNYKGLSGKWGFDANGDTTLKIISGNVVSAKAFNFEKLLGIQ